MSNDRSDAFHDEMRDGFLQGLQCHDENVAELVRTAEWVYHLGDWDAVEMRALADALRPFKKGGA